MLLKSEILAIAAKLKHGAEVLKLHQELLDLGVTSYYYSVTEGTHQYYNDAKDLVEEKSDCGGLFVVRIASREAAEQAVLKYRNYAYDFPTFCRALASSGVYEYVADLAKGKIAYIDQTGNEIFVEALKS
ncbi:MAG: DUF1398 family protein [Clostridia bacterium]